MAWYIMSTEGPVRNFGKKNACIIVNVLYFRRIDRERAVFTEQLEHAASYETIDHAMSRLNELHAGSVWVPYLSTIEIK